MSSIIVANAVSVSVISNNINSNGIIKIKYDTAAVDNQYVLVDLDSFINMNICKTDGNEVTLSSTQKLLLNKAYILKDSKGLINYNFTTVASESTATTWLQRTVNVGISDTIVVNFDKNILNIQASNVRLVDLSNNGIVNFSLVSNGNNIIITPSTALSVFKKYAVEINGVFDEQSGYYSSTSVFSTILPSPVLSDNDIANSGYSETGSWGGSGIKGYNNTGTRYATGTTNKELDIATWKPNLVGGRYSVDMYRVVNPTTPDNTPYANLEIFSLGGTTNGTVTLNDFTVSDWHNLGTYDFPTGNSGYVRVKRVSNSTGNLRTDHMRFTPVLDNTNPTATMNYNGKLNICFSKYMKDDSISNVVLSSNGLDKNVTIVSVNNKDYHLSEKLDREKDYTIILPQGLKSYDGYDLSETSYSFQTRKLSITPVIPTIDGANCKFDTFVEGASATLLVGANKQNGNLEKYSSTTGEGKISVEMQGVSINEVNTFVVDSVDNLKPISTLPQTASLTLNTPIVYDGTNATISAMISGHKAGEKGIVAICKKQNPTENIVFIQAFSVAESGAIHIVYPISTELDGGEYIAIINIETAINKIIGEFYNINAVTIEKARVNINACQNNEEIEQAILKNYIELGIDAETFSFYKQLTNKNMVNEKLLKKAFVTVTDITTEFNNVMALTVLNQLNEYDKYLNKYKAQYHISLDDYSTILDKSKFIINMKKYLPISSNEMVLGIFEKSVAISLLNQSSWGNIESILLKYKDTFGIDTTVFSSLSSAKKDSVVKPLANKDFQSLDDVKNAFNDGVSDATKIVTQPRPSGSSGGGSNVIIKVDEVPKAPLIEAEKSYGFTDLENILWAKDSINKLFELGVVEGFPDKTFKGDIGVTREQFIKMIVVAFDIGTNKDECSFSDISKDDWSYTYIARATQNGIINGVSADKFGKGQSLSRQDMAVILDRLSNKVNISLKETNPEIDYTDAVEIDEYAAGSISKLQKAGIISGVSSDTFAPSTTSTRAMSAKVIYEILKLKEGE
jgi:hypothetical protein